METINNVIYFLSGSISGVLPIFVYQIYKKCFVLLKWNAVTSNNETFLFRATKGGNSFKISNQSYIDEKTSQKVVLYALEIFNDNLILNKSVAIMNENIMDLFDAAQKYSDYNTPKKLTRQGSH